MDVDGSETDTPPQTIKPISFIDATLLHRPPPPPMAAAYKECMKNHAAEIGGHAVDGCGEFMQSDSPSPSSAAACHTSLTCAACGCHRNFHRRDPESTPSSAAITPPFLNFRHPPLPKRFSISLSHSPPSPSSTPTPPETHARNVLFGLAAAAAAAADNQNHRGPITPFGRTKFSEEQKEKMQSFAAELGWRMQKSDEAAVREFCREIGVPRGVLKVWMHNNKNTFCKNETNGGGITKDGGLRFESSGGGDEEEI